MQIFICPDCKHKSVFDPWMESALCPRCGYTPPPPSERSKGGPTSAPPVPVVREEIIQIYKSAKRRAPDFIILVRRDDHLFTFGQDAANAIEVLGEDVRTEEGFDGVPAPSARIPFEEREKAMKRLQAAGFSTGMPQFGVLTCPRCGLQNVTKDIHFPSYRCSQCGYVPPERDQLVQAFLTKGIEDIREGRLEPGRQTLNLALHHEGTVDQQTEAQYWLAEATPNLYQKQEHLREALALNPNDESMTAAIQSTLAQVEAILAGEIASSPDALDPNEPAAERAVAASRHTCPQCGGKMGFLPQEGCLVCLNCRHRQKPNQRLDAVEEQSFVSAMAALRGHSRPAKTKLLECMSCGAVFLLAPATLSQTCPYCASAYTLDGEASSALIPPTGLLPFEITQTKAQSRLQFWIQSKGISTSEVINYPLGIYLPLWTFDLGGSLSWEASGFFSSRSKTQPVFFDDILVPGVEKILTGLLAEGWKFDYRKLKPYSPDYLANWPAETYDIALSDAALKARWKAIDSFRKKHGLYGNVQLRTTDLRIETFKLLLVPLWFALFNHGGVRHRIVINGQDGAVWSQDFSRLQS